MKKNQQKSPYEDKSDPMRSLDIDLDDDDIIDLEDIIEMPDRPINEEEDLDLGVEIFDVDEELESKPTRAARKGFLVSESPPEAEELDLLESLTADTDEQQNLFDPTPPAPKAKPAEAKARPGIFDEEDEESILDDLLNQPIPSDARGAKKAGLRPGAGAAQKIAEDDWPEDIFAAGSSEPTVLAQASDPGKVPGPSASDISAVAEELVGRIESGLQEYIRTLVESKLPGLVRSIIDEEIAKLKEELP